MATQEQVSRAADALAAQDKKVTVATVREALGAGSYSTLSPMLRAWREQHLAQVALTEALPGEAEEAGRKAAAAIWQTAMVHLQQRAERVEQAAEERITEAMAERDEAMGEVQRLEDKLGHANKYTVALQEQREALSAQVSEAKATIEGLRERLEAESTAHGRTGEKAERAHEQLAGERARAEAAEKGLATERKEHDGTRSALVEERSRADRAEQRDADAQSALTELRAEHKELHQALCVAREEAAQLRGRLVQAEPQAS
ncbi:MAG: DNA-binding protein [Nitrococcus sp.]|nr:DNA-binding protein [Nitrococcus sp.]